MCILFSFPVPNREKAEERDKRWAFSEENSTFKIILKVPASREKRNIRTNKTTDFFY